jgi:spore coat polysaccharide biosynthesis protein SpsF
MQNKYATPQEEFWTSEFGNEYINRNSGENNAANIRLFAKILSNTINVKSVIEFGSNIGLNLHAIRNLLPTANLSAIEINSKACEQLRNDKKLNLTEIMQDSILDITFREREYHVFYYTPV